MRVPVAILILLVASEAHAMPDCVLEAVERGACRSGQASPCAMVSSGYLRGPRFRGHPEAGRVQELSFALNSSSDAYPFTGRYRAWEFVEGVMTSCKDWVPDGDWVVTDRGLGRKFQSNKHLGHGLATELRIMHGEGAPIVMISITMFGLDPFLPAAAVPAPCSTARQEVP